MTGYFGMTVRNAGHSFVLRGPPVTLVPGPSEQLDTATTIITATLPSNWPNDYPSWSGYRLFGETVRAPDWFRELLVKSLPCVKVRLAKLLMRAERQAAFLDEAHEARIVVGRG
jgi:hypothetical protein